MGLVGDLMTPHHSLCHWWVGGEEREYFAYVPRWIRMCDHIVDMVIE